MVLVLPPTLASPEVDLEPGDTWANGSVRGSTSSGWVERCSRNGKGLRVTPTGSGRSHRVDRIAPWSVEEWPTFLPVWGVYMPYSGSEVVAQK